MLPTKITIRNGDQRQTHFANPTPQLLFENRTCSVQNSHGKLLKQFWRNQQTLTNLHMHIDCPAHSVVYSETPKNICKAGKYEEMYTNNISRETAVMLHQIVEHRRDKFEENNEKLMQLVLWRTADHFVCCQPLYHLLV